MKSLYSILSELAKGERPLNCAACGQQFNCGASLAGCWCSVIKVSDETRARLRNQYQDCLCEKCLRQESDKCELSGVD